MNYDKLKGKMREKKISQSEMARNLGITVQAFNGKINGKRQFTVEEAVGISKFLRLDDPVEIFFTPNVPYMQQMKEKRDSA